MGEDGNGLRRLTSPAVRSQEPAWSPEGTRLAYASRRGGNWDIYLYDEEGRLHRLTNDPDFDMGPWFSPDGKRIAFSTTRNGTWDIWTMNVDGSDQRPLTVGKRSEYDPVYSPDGKWIGFESNERGPWDVKIMPAKGGEAIDVAGRICRARRHLLGHTLHLCV